MPSSNRSLVAVKILISGSEIKEAYDIIDLRVTKELNRIAAAQISIIDGSVAEEEFKLSEGKEFVPGNEIELQAGFGSATKSIFKGIIISQTIRIRETGGPMLVIQCKDKALKMTIGRKSGAFTNKQDSEIMQELAKRSGISATITSTTGSIPQMVQYYVTDWDFLVMRAEVNGMVVIACDNQLKVGPPKTTGSPEQTLTFGQDIVEIEATLSARSQLNGVQAQAWDFKSQKLGKASAANPSVTDQGNLSGQTLAGVSSPTSINLVSTVPLETGALKSWADAQLLKSRLSKIGGVIKAFGDAALMPDQVIALKGVGKRFNGTAYVSGVEHIVKDGNWWSVISTGLDPHWFAEQVEPTCQPAAALIPGIRGLQNATVKQVVQDPDGQTQIQVTVPTLTVDSEPGDVWARWTQPYATNGAGTFFMPEVGDEVVLGFLNEDPRYPVILGSLYSSKKAPPLQPADKNPKKAIITMSKLTIEFDDQNKVLTIKTPGKNQIVLSDQDQGITIQDQNSNKISMTSQGITIKSPKAINIEASGQAQIKGAGISVNSDAQATVQAQSSLSLSGTSVSLSGKTSLSISGGAEGSISASGELSLSAPLLKLN